MMLGFIFLKPPQRAEIGSVIEVGSRNCGYGLDWIGFCGVNWSSLLLIIADWRLFIREKSTSVGDGNQLLWGLDVAWAKQQQFSEPSATVAFLLLHKLGVMTRSHDCDWLYDAFFSFLYILLYLDVLLSLTTSLNYRVYSSKKKTDGTCC